MKKLKVLITLILFIGLNAHSLKGYAQKINLIDNLKYETNGFNSNKIDQTNDKSDVYFNNPCKLVISTSAVAPSDKIVKWNGKNWKLLDSLMNNSNNSMVEYNNSIYETGSYTMADGSTVSYFRKSDATIIENKENILEIKAYPTPFTTFTTLYLPCAFLNDNESTNTLVLYNLLGEEVKRIENIKTKEIIIFRDNLPEGSYFFLLSDNKKNRVTGKLIIQ